MTDEPQIIETPSQPADDRLGYDPDKSRRNAEFYAKRPEALQVTLDELAKITGQQFVPHERFNELQSQVQAIKREAAVAKALMKHQLSEEHARFIVGDTPEAIAESAEAFAAIIAAQAKPGEVKPKPEPKPDPPAERYEERKPEYNMDSPEQAKIALNRIIAEANRKPRD